MPAQPLTETQLEEARSLKQHFRIWQAKRRQAGEESSQDWAAEQLGFGQSALNQYLNGKIPLNPEAAAKFANLLSIEVTDFSPTVAGAIARLSSLGLAVPVTSSVAAPAPHSMPAPDGGEPDLVITQYDETGGSMGHGFNLTDNPPGHIRSWRVTHEWLRLNVPVHTGVKNLAIVTGFGPSMKPMFNPGDPLLVDTGVKVVDHEGVYFFRVGDEGFIKLIQRVPEFDGPGVRLRVISKNPDFPPYDLSPKNPHFEVLGKVLTVWRSEQF